MRRSLPVLLLSALLLAPAAPAAADGELRLRARLVACTTGEQPAARAVTFRATMPRVPGAARLQMRFALLQRLGRHRAFRRVRGVRGWDRWETSDPGRSGLVLTRRVHDLAAPAAYRAVVRFRWLDAGGEVLRRAVRTTRTCLQPDPRPDLRLGALTAAPEGDLARYRLVVRNAGRTAARAFGIVLLVGGQAQRTVPAGPILGGGEEVVEMVAPRCEPGSLVEVLLDAQGAVAETREHDNAVVRPCPL